MLNRSKSNGGRAGATRSRNGADRVEIDNGPGTERSRFSSTDAQVFPFVRTIRPSSGHPSTRPFSDLPSTVLSCALFAICPRTSRRRRQLSRPGPARRDGVPRCGSHDDPFSRFRALPVDPEATRDYDETVIPRATDCCNNKPDLPKFHLYVVTATQFAKPITQQSNSVRESTVSRTHATH